MILPVGGIGERYGYHSDTVALGCRHKAAPTALCISGLNAYSAAVHFKKPVVVYKQPWVVTAGDSGLVGGYYLGKRFVFKRSRSDQGKIRGGRIVLLVVKPVGICEMSVREAQCFGALIHHMGKFLNAAADGDRDCRCRVVGTFQQHGVQKLAKSQLLTGFQIDRRTLNACGNIGYLNNLVKFAVFYGDKRRHNFGSARHGEPFARVLFKHRAAALRLYKNCTLCVHLRRGDLVRRRVNCRR